MAGTLVKLLDCKGTTSGANAVQEQFVLLYIFMEAMASAGHCTRIALQWGNGGTGTDFWDGANPFGENAFAVYTWGAGAGTARDVMIQWATTDAFGAAPGNPGAINGGTGDGVGIVMATREDGTSPWAGSTNNDGTDTKGSPVWSAGASVLHVLDVANTTGGSYAANKENCLRAALGSPNAMRLHMVGDADAIAILSSETDDGNYRALHLGRYTPRTGWSGPNPLFAMAEMQAVMWSAANYGSAAGSLQKEGGVLGRSGADGVAVLSLADVTFGGLLNDTFQPNQQINPQQLDGVLPLLVYGSAVRYGLVGSSDGGTVAVFYTDLNHAVDPTSSRAYLGSAVAGPAHRYGIPWDGGAAPGVGVTRAGRLS